MSSNALSPPAVRRHTTGRRRSPCQPPIWYGRAARLGVGAVLDRPSAGTTSARLGTVSATTPRNTQRQPTCSATSPASTGPTITGTTQAPANAANTRGCNAAGYTWPTTTYSATVSSPPPKPWATRPTMSTHICGASPATSSPATKQPFRSTVDGPARAVALRAADHQADDPGGQRTAEGQRVQREPVQRPGHRRHDGRDRYRFERGERHERDHADGQGPIGPGERVGVHSTIVRPQPGSGQARASASFRHEWMYGVAVIRSRSLSCRTLPTRSSNWVLSRWSPTGTCWSRAACTRLRSETLAARRPVWAPPVPAGSCCGHRHCVTGWMMGCSRVRAEDALDVPARLRMQHRANESAPFAPRSRSGAGSSGVPRPRSSGSGSPAIGLGFDDLAAALRRPGR